MTNQGEASHHSLAPGTFEVAIGGSIHEAANIVGVESPPKIIALVVGTVLIVDGLRRIVKAL